MKQCHGCGIEKEDTEFYKRTLRSGKIGLQSKCKSCATAVRRKYYKPHSSIRLQLGLTNEDVAAVTSKGKCEGCGTTDRRLCIDHDHKTNKVRGLLCHNCNTALGLLNDDTSLLSNLITYLNDRSITEAEPSRTELG